MIKNIQQWFQSKGGMSHVIAGAYLFLLAAYGTVPQFHSLVQTVNQHLPGWVEELAAAVVGLAGFYKNWDAKNANRAVPGQGSANGTAGSINASATKGNPS